MRPGCGPGGCRAWRRLMFHFGATRRVAWNSAGDCTTFDDRRTVDEFANRVKKRLLAHAREPGTCVAVRPSGLVFGLTAETKPRGGVMDPLRELLATDHRQALEFFFLGLQDVSEPTVDRQELLYNASLLAHYAQVSTQAHATWPAPANLSVVFDHFVSDTTLMHDGLMMETAGAQCLLLAGFFEDQMR